MRRLVVIGNGMAGARTVEEIRERGGADLFDITVFGDEPYGNYNRIMLSNVLAGVEDEAGIFLNEPRLVRRERHHPARRRAGRPHRPVAPGWCTPTTARSTPYDKLDHRHRQPRVHPADRRRPPPRPRLPPGRLRVPHARRHPQHDPVRAASTNAPSSSAAACSAWRPRADCRATCGHVTLVHAARPPDEHPARRAGRRDPAAQRRAARHRGGHRRADHARSSASTRSPASGSTTAGRSTATSWWSPPASGPTPSVAAASGLPVERGIVVDDQMRVPRRAGHLRGRRVRRSTAAQMYGLVAPLWEQAHGARRPRHRRQPAAPPTTARGRHQAQGGRRRRGRDGPQGARARRTTRSSSSPSRARASTRASSSATAGWSARRSSATSTRSPSSCRRSTAGCRCRRTAPSCCSTSAGRRPR